MQICSSLFLDKIAHTKQITPLVKAKSLTCPRLMLGGFGRRTSDAKVRTLREKCLENLARELELSFGENEGVYIGMWPATLGGDGPATWMVLWVKFMICG